MKQQQPCCQKLNAQQAKAILDSCQEVVLVDVRTQPEYEKAISLAVFCCLNKRFASLPRESFPIWMPKCWFTAALENAVPKPRRN